MTDDFYDFEDHSYESQGRGHLFLWAVFILLLIGFAFACWLGSFYIFGHPEQARPYRLLMKLHKLDPPKRFDITAAPPGDFLTPQKLFDRYSRMSRLQLQDENASLLRNYIKNYRETKDRVPYATGRFEIISSYELQPVDLVTSGMVALAVSEDHPQVLIEHIYPTPVENVPRLKALLQEGLDLKLEKTYDIAAVIHVERTPDSRFLFTVIPLTYGNYVLKQGVGAFSLEPPFQVNVGAGAPVVRGDVLAKAMKLYAEQRHTRTTPEEAAKAPEPELVRVDPDPAVPVPASGAMPQPAAATPLAMQTPAIASAHLATPNGKTGALAVRSSTPKGRGSPVPVATPLAANSPAGVPLKPFISSLPGRNARAGESTHWTVYPPGQQPAGKTVSVGDAIPLADRGEPGERTYLRGSFVVTDSGPNYAVLRAQGDSGGRAASARIIVNYPSSALPPPRGATFSRDELRAFQIQDVRHANDGQVDIDVREVTQP